MDLREVPEGALRRHPWEVARAGFFGGLLSGALAGGGAARILDVGAGDGYVGRELLRRLPPGASVTCVDSEYTDAQLKVFERDAPAGLCFSTAAPNGPFDALVLLDVLEHVEDDLGLLRELVESRLRAGGVALVSVPAHAALYTRHDVVLGHHRRYSRAGLSALVRGAGLDVARSGGLFASLLLPRAAQKGLELLRGERTVPDPAGLQAHAETGLSSWGGGALVTTLVRSALSADAAVGARLAAIGLPAPGLSVWALCRRPG